VDLSTLAGITSSGDTYAMTTSALETSASDSADLSGSISKRMLRYLKAQVEDWYDVCRGLTSWEERHLLGEPTAEILADHARILDELERVGHWLSLPTQSPDFPDRATAELVQMTLQDLKDRRALWHGTVPAERRKEILRSIFNEP
jgi:hypothetical protein